MHYVFLITFLCLISINLISANQNCGKNRCETYYNSYCCGYNSSECCYFFYSGFFWFSFGGTVTLFFMCLVIALMCLRQRQRKMNRMVSSIPFYNQMYVRNQMNPSYVADLPPPYQTVINNPPILNSQSLTVNKF
ncbi:unnamed protein product [Brachionus calyciflorus]|uniref:Vesicular, overexpressed in cancer, prosurvival protein 1 n=1 Tax=Brachionus calyciflorus TaxID=104777 RepID=A0A813YY00_9BILA|nr:unnamed protein product [Brachionus calyciflorus]